NSSRLAPSALASQAARASAGCSLAVGSMTASTFLLFDIVQFSRTVRVSLPALALHEQARSAGPDVDSQAGREDAHVCSTRGRRRASVLYVVPELMSELHLLGTLRHSVYEARPKMRLPDSPRISVLHDPRRCRGHHLHIRRSPVRRNVEL